MAGVSQVGPGNDIAGGKPAVAHLTTGANPLYDPPMPRRPLHGIRIVDLTLERGELTGRLLADLGAEVLRVEPPGGSPARSMLPLVGDQSLFFTFRNAGKKGVELDLRNDPDLSLIHI